MTRVPSYYPPSPGCVPENLTAPTEDYRARVVLVLVSLILFFLMYLGLIFLTGFLTFRALFKLRAGVNLLVAFFPALVFLFLVKGLFKRQPLARRTSVEITEEDHPRLFAFLDLLCAETNAPFPHRVFLDYEVNAAVFYNDSLLSLFWPTPKNLLIGMGLIHSLTLSEFKAVLAHEFGHFTQSSMKLGKYVYTANRIILDMVAGRDWLDRLVLRLRAPNNRLAPLGWTLWGIIWGLRKALTGCFYGINFLNLSLSRQMEFQADLVAVSVTGSDAIINALSRLNLVTEALELAADELRTAADHRLYTRDLFYHHSEAVTHLRRLRKDPRLGEPPPEANGQRPVRIFDPDEESGPPPMWSSHPSNADREWNAKRRYVPWPLDGRSPWLLFEDPPYLREVVTWRFYRAVFNLKKEAPLSDPRVVQAFIDDERAETTYDPRYHGLYDGRFVRPGDPAALEVELRARPLPPAELARLHDKLYDEAFVERMKEHAALVAEHQKLVELKEGRRAEEFFTFRGRRYALDQLRRLLVRVEVELEQDREWTASLDRQVYLCHSQMARELGPGYARELHERYAFHLALQGISGALLEQHDRLKDVLALLAGRTHFNLGEFQEVMDTFRQAHAVLVQGLAAADKLLLPPLKNMTAGEPVGYFLMEKKLVPEFRRFARSLSGKKVNKFLQQLGEVLDKIRRIHFKSLGALLAFQETIAVKWKARRAGLDDVEVVRPGASAVDEVEVVPDRPPGAPRG